jgi:hypothetical protein
VRRISSTRVRVLATSQTHKICVTRDNPEKKTLIVELFTSSMKKKTTRFVPFAQPMTILSITYTAGNPDWKSMAIYPCLPLRLRVSASVFFYTTAE